MSRYHINDKTGNPGICKAKKKCPFGDLDTEHYESKELAREAYENKMKTENLKEVYKNSFTNSTKKNMNSFTERAIEDNKLVINNFIKKYGVNTFNNSNNSSKSEESISEELKKYTDSAQSLFSNFLIPEGEENAGSFLSPTDVQFNYSEDENGRYVKDELTNPPDQGDYKFIGCGVEANVFLNEEEGMVYKIPNTFDMKNQGPWDEDKIARRTLEMDIQKRVYEALDRDALAKDNAEYSETYFLKVKDGNGIEFPVVAQKYLPKDEYEEFEMPGEVFEKLNSYKLISDIHSENVYVNKKTKRIVLIDCLNYWDDEDFKSLIGR